MHKKANKLFICNTATIMSTWKFCLCTLMLSSSRYILLLYRGSWKNIVWKICDWLCVCMFATSFIHLKNIAITTLTRGVNACVYKMQLNLLISHDCIKCWFCWMQKPLLWMNFSSGVLAFQLCNFSMFPSEAFLFSSLDIIIIVCIYVWSTDGSK